MDSFGYYSFADSKDKPLIASSDDARDDVALYVNCAGVISKRAGFTTYNPAGRRDYYLLYLLRGTLTVSLAEGEVEATEGSVIFFPPCTPYRYTFRGSEEGIFYLWVHFTGGDVPLLLDTLGLSPLPRIANIGHAEQITTDFDRMFSDYAKAGKFRDLALASTLSRILVDIAEHLFATEGDCRLSRSLTYIHLHYTEKLRVGDLARLEAVSPSRYSELFRRKTGKPPIDYIISLRIRHAASLLETTNLPVGEVAETVGFSDVHFFSKLFKKHTGVSPSDYRKNRKTPTDAEKTPIYENNRLQDAGFPYEK